MTERLHMYYGGDYNPEQFPEEVWREDIALMREASVNLVTVGVFSWSRIQRAEGEFDWEWLDTILGMLHDAGIGVDLATGTASPPPWASAANPDILPVDQSGRTLWPGSRQHYAASSPSYRRLAADLVHAVAERYAHHPAVVMWHVNNELGCHVARDYSDSARDAFQRWLHARYGTVEALNRAWGTAFWSQLYTDFAEVLPPRLAPAQHNPGMLLDFRRFSSDSLRELLVMERDIIRQHGATQPITTNFMGAFPEGDYWSWAAEVDFVSDDNYPDPNYPTAFRRAAFSCDLMRSLKPGTPWLLMEQATGSVTWRPSNAPKAPGQMAALSAQAVARGAEGILFFQWRQSERGAEQFFSAMLPHAGTATRTWREVVALGGRLRTLPTLPPCDQAEVGLLLEWESWWAIESADLPLTISYSESVLAWHEALQASHIPVDLIHSRSDLSKYRVIVAPLAFLLSQQGAANLASFVRAGGHLLVTALSDIVDESCGLRRGGFQTQLRELTGVASLEFGVMLAPSAASGSEGPGEWRAPVSGEGIAAFDGHFLAEEIDIIDPQVEIHARFSGGRRSGGPALTSLTNGDGEAYYLPTILDQAGASAVLGWLLPRAGVEAPFAALDPMIELVTRGDTSVVINHTSEARATGLSGTDPSTNVQEDDVRLEPFGWRLLRSVQVGAPASPPS